MRWTITADHARVTAARQYDRTTLLEGIMVLLLAIAASFVILVFPASGVARTDAPGSVRQAAAQHLHDNRCFAAGLVAGGFLGALVGAGIPSRNRRSS